MTQLGNRIEIAIPDVDAALEDFTSLRLYSASTRSGSYSNLTDLTLVSGTNAYSYAHTGGARTTWYKWSYYSGSNESNKTEPFPAQSAPAITRQTIRQLAAHYLGLYGLPATQYSFPGPSGTTTGAGSTTSLVCSSYAQSRAPTNKYRDWWIRMTSGSADGEDRQVNAAVNFSSGTFTTDAFSAATGNGSTFELYGQHPASWWDVRVNEGLLHVWTPFDLALSGFSQQTEYALPYWIERKGQIRDLAFQSGTTIRKHVLTPGQDYELDEKEGGGCTIWFRRSLPTTSVYILSGFRRPPQLFADTDVIYAGDELTNQITISVAARAAYWLAQEHGRPAEDRRMWAERADKLEAERQAIAESLRIFKTTRNPRYSPMIAVGGWGDSLAGTSGRSAHY